MKDTSVNITDENRDTVTFRAQDYIDANMQLSLGSDVKVRFEVDESYPDDIALVIGDSAVKITFDPATVEVLRDKADAAIRESRAAIARLKAGAGAQYGMPGMATSPAENSELLAEGQVA